MDEVVKERSELTRSSDVPYNSLRFDKRSPTRPLSAERVQERSGANDVLSGKRGVTSARPQKGSILRRSRLTERAALLMLPAAAAVCGPRSPTHRKARTRHLGSRSIALPQKLISLHLSSVSYNLCCPNVDFFFHGAVDERHHTEKKVS